ncbi:uncharacterized protein [Bemisia tabaci]
MKTVTILIAVLPQILTALDFSAPKLPKVNEKVLAIFKHIEDAVQGDDGREERAVTGKNETNPHMLENGTILNGPLSYNELVTNQCIKLYDSCLEASFLHLSKSNTTKSETSRFSKLASKITAVMLSFFDSDLWKEAIVTGASHIVADRCHAIKLECFIKTGFLSKLADEVDPGFPGAAKLVEMSARAVKFLTKLPGILESEEFLASFMGEAVKMFSPRKLRERFAD